MSVTVKKNIIRFLAILIGNYSMLIAIKKISNLSGGGVQDLINNISYFVTSVIFLKYGLTGRVFYQKKEENPRKDKKNGSDLQ